MRQVYQTCQAFSLARWVHLHTKVELQRRQHVRDVIIHAGGPLRVVFVVLSVLRDLEVYDEAQRHVFRREGHKLEPTRVAKFVSAVYRLAGD
jgi:hypothetical protein